jgi:hypothetical protein
MRVQKDRALGNQRKLPPAAPDTAQREAAESNRAIARPMKPGGATCSSRPVDARAADEVIECHLVSGGPLRGTMMPNRLGER